MVGDAMVGPSRAGCGGERIARIVGGDRASKRLETVDFRTALCLVLAIVHVHYSPLFVQLWPTAIGALGIRCLVGCPSNCLRQPVWKGAKNKRLEAIGDHGAGATAFRDVCI